jgi:hypothetical protein
VAIKFSDMKTWQDISSALTFQQGKGVRPGTVLSVPEIVVVPIQNY